MSFSTSRLAYADVIEVLDRALASPSGLRLDFPSGRSATTFVSRATYFRGLDRGDNKKLYPDPVHELHGRSQYDRLQISQIPARMGKTHGGPLVVISFHTLRATISELTAEELAELSTQYGQTAEQILADGIDNEPKT